MICELCKREVDETTFHHLIPVTLHTKKWYQKNYNFNYLKTHGIDVCELCHYAIHHFYDEKTLGKNYNTLELLLESELIQKHIKWARKQKTSH
ncbi:MAG: hypothetical protein HPY57_14825 [Ignavibacteria bacterium]|nr:hypothetical protein [Ignavibacteria bacterium]